jgi:hypothetical protein
MPRPSRVSVLSLAFTVVVGALACGACTKSVGAVAWAEAPDGCERPSSMVPASPPAIPGLDDDGSRTAQWAKIARTVPGGFAGIVRKPGDRWELLMVDPARRDTLISVVARRLRMQSTSSQPVLPSIRQVRWNYAQLYDWYRLLLAREVSKNAPVSIEIDEFNNRILIEVPDKLERLRILRRVEAIGVPCFLIAVRVNSFPRLARSPSAGRRGESLLVSASGAKSLRREN